MIQVVRQGGDFARNFVQKFRSRSEAAGKKVDATVSEILSNVKQNGDAAVRDYTLKFDGSIPESTEVSLQEMKQLVKSCDPEFLSALQKAADNIKDFHARQKQQSWMEPRADGVLMGQRIRGLDRVGIYVPGGTAAYPSSVLMNAIPAKIAGVKELIMVTPPGKGGKPNPNIMAAALTAGVDRVFLVGGAQAVAALAYGTETIPKVDKIVGPGNIYVATAKRQLYGTVDIDMIAGPSEILIIADETAKPAYLAADLMSQAEHDRMASAVLLTTSETIADETITELYQQIKSLSRKEIIENSLDNFGAVILCKNLNEAVEFANEIAPEHLELCVKNPVEYIGKIDNAGSVFLGNYSPEPLGDYYAGPNHVLPTSGTARFFSPLSVDSFIKKSSFIYYTKDALAPVCNDIMKLAETEGLTAHANSIKVRKQDGISH
ncbi:MAG TPA: histidinol dehydrogenase [Ruminococcaceae bacterium]|jgi:histidinol dehydrogenase|nr:histidinol dehydrogenase [Oscillospiraceae bacterium]HCC03062.1 histidinol dehydrogenase [Oscillospiraceae bacterium]HCM24304.1 histidinol dehydrogenase [Oscillospiraceae bacterium]